MTAKICKQMKHFPNLHFCDVCYITVSSFTLSNISFKTATVSLTYFPIAISSDICTPYMPDLYISYNASTSPIVGIGFDSIFFSTYVARNTLTFNNGIEIVEDETFSIQATQDKILF